MTDAQEERLIEALTKVDVHGDVARAHAVARQSGWKRCGELDGQFGGRGEEMIVAPRQ